jgi:uncharacterized membrane protein YphA (DoxX/SURF4 family)
MSRVESLSLPLPKLALRRIAARIVLPSVALLFRLTVGSVFLYSSLSKLQQPYDFLSAVYSYELVGPQLGLWVTATIPWLELATGICLVLGFWDRSAWILAIALLSVFTAALYSVASRGLLVPCGCVCTPIEIVSYRSVLTTGLLLLAAVVGLGCSLAAAFFRMEVPDSSSSGDR